MSEISFNEKKATQAAAILLNRRGGKMSYMKLIKLLYLADRESLLKWGRTITNDRYVSMDRGPVLSRVFNLITDQKQPGEAAIWSKIISDPEKYEIELKGNPENDELSEAEEAVLNEIFDKYGKMSRWDLVSETHHLPEWIDPHGSAIQISYRDILKAGGKTEIETAAIEGELNYLAETDSVFTSP